MSPKPFLSQTASLLLLCAALTGCGIGTVTTSSTGTIHLSGQVHGGQQPVSGSTIQLYAVGTGGNGSGATPLITPTSVLSGTGAYPVLTDGNGDFTITGDYTCPSSGTQVYIVSSGGNPGLTPGTNNSALVLMTALGSCTNLLNHVPFVNINEVTTVAAVWALAPFMTSYSGVGSTSTNSAGMANAMQNAQLLASYTTGLAATLLSGETIETNKLYALADALASCVNSTGAITGPTNPSNCYTLFSAATPVGGTAPTNTVGAALNIVRNPGQNVSAVYGAIGGTPPFATGYTQAPNDWTMSLTITSPNMVLPTTIAIDPNGYVWAAGQEGTLDEYSPQGTLLSDMNWYSTTACSGSPCLQEVFGMAIDTNGYLWVTDYQGQNYYPSGPDNSSGELVQFQSSSTGGTPGAPVMIGGYDYRPNSSVTDTSIQYPDAVSADANGNVFVLNTDPSSASVYTNGTQSPVSASLGQYPPYYIVEPLGLAVDSSHGFWMADADNTVSHYNSSGTLNGYVTCCNESYGIATDSGGNLWVANYGSSSFSEVTSSFTTALNQVATGGVNHPAGVTVDAGQNVWIANYRGKSVTEIAGIANTVLTGTTTALTAGTAISPTTGVYTTGGYGLDASLNGPIALVPDAAGNLWVANESNNDVVMFFGLATPTKMPVQPIPTAP